jgi:hypothetical protein
LDRALKIAKSARYESEQFATLKAVGIAAAQSPDPSLVSKGLDEVLDSIVLNRWERISQLASAFADQGLRDGIKVLLPFCAEHPHSAMAVAGSLIRVYPEQGPAIARTFLTLTRDSHS